MIVLPPGKMLVLFDGVCNLCNASVQFILKHDHKDRFLFASLQGETGQSILKDNNLPTNVYHSFLLFENNKLYSKSTAALRTVKSLSGLRSLIYGFIVVPKIVRDIVYDFISRHRYKWFGRKESCMIPLPEYRAKFLD